VISHFYTAFIKINAVRYLLLGMQSGVSAVICDAVYTMFKTVWKESRWIALITSVIAFVLVAVLSVNVIIIIIACIILGIILYGRGEKKA
jgi:chromate transport protein ChrA